MSSRKTYFNDNWLIDNNLSKNWSFIREVKGDRTSAYCKLCQKSFSLSNMGKAAITSHFSSKCHLNKMNNAATSSSIQQFFERLKESNCSDAITDSTDSTSKEDKVPTPNATTLVSQERTINYYTNKTDVVSKG